MELYARTLYDVYVHCTMYTVLKYNVYGIYYTPYSLRRTRYFKVYSTHHKCTVYNVWYTIYYNVHYTQFIVQCIL